MWGPVVELGEWLPDQPDLSAPALREARGVYPRARGYDVFPTSRSANRGSIDTRCRGAFAGRTRQGTQFVVAGTTAKLWLSTTVAFTDETWLTGPYTTDKRWDFALFGDDIIAVNYTEAPQRYVLGTSTEFAALHANAPRARHAAIVREFLVLGNLVGRGSHAAIYGTREDAVHWSGQGDPASWETAGTNPAAAKLSDWQPLVDDGGQVTDLVGGQDYGLIFKERSIWRMDFVGGSEFFAFVPVDPVRGCVVPGSAIRIGGRTYFISDQGLCFTDGGGSTPFGSERVDRWLHDLIDHSRYEYVSTFVHPHLPLLGWGFRSDMHGADSADKVLLYNYAVDRFSYLDLSHEVMLTGSTLGESLDGATYGATDLDAGILAALSLDNLSGNGSGELSFFGTDHSLLLLDVVGSGGQSGELETGDFELASGRTAVVRAVWPLFRSAGVGASVTVRRRRRSADALTDVAFEPETASGAHRGRARGRYHAARLTLSGDYREVHGLQADFVPAGER